MGECADFYAPKVVRATMGSVFRVPVRAVTLEELRDAMTEQNIPLYAAALDARAAQISELSLSRACVLIGNEARGLSAQALALCDRAVYIPMRGAESLNAAVAASVFLWEMSKQQSVRG
ncbi:MAG: TrmH family RNA methyltransferase [Clostridia bacterium]|nr:TrmH family RNA methyltransferase [Clostridia bacterium]